MPADPKPQQIASLTVSPEQMVDIAYLLYKGWTVDSISREVRLPISKIQEIKEQHPETAGAHKEFIIGKLNEFVSRGIDRMCEQMSSMHIDKLPIALGIIIDKAQLLQGQATTRIDTGKGISQERLIDILERMKRAKPPNNQHQPSEDNGSLVDTNDLTNLPATNIVELHGRVLDQTTPRRN